VRPEPPAGIDPATLEPDPYRQLGAWLEEGASPDPPLPASFALATATADGEPSVRMVLLQSLDERGLAYYSDRRSRKGRDVQENPRGAGLFHWPRLERQARVHGRIELVPPPESAAYFATRPFGSQVTASISHQGQPIDSREELERLASQLAGGRTEGELPLPPYWGGYRLVPLGFEFWLSRADRLHDRVEYRRTFDGGWELRRLQP
jgi:pyridoxamine 5'-phosphate oxidase